MTDEIVSADWPYTSRYLDVLGSRMHYVEAGTGDSSAAPAGGDGVVDAEFEEIKDGKDGKDQE